MRLAPAACITFLVAAPPAPAQHFPQRISCKALPDNRLAARIEGLRGGRCAASTFR